MIKFNKITWKNFLSTGNVENVIQLDSHNTSLIVGKNGHGKSTILDALCFALYGRAYRNINKSQLINSINQKQSLVSVEFLADSVTYKIVRGQKPNIFEFYANGELVDQDASNKDYQTRIEQVLKMNFKTFVQVVILGANSNAPFMQLAAAARRDLIENVLDIKVFSIMNDILKKKIQDNKTEFDVCDRELQIIKNSISSVNSILHIIKSNKEANASKIELKIHNIQVQLEENSKRRVDCIEKLSELNQRVSELNNLNSDKAKISEAKIKISTNLSRYRTQREFFNANNVCQTCEQHISDNHKLDMIAATDALMEADASKLEVIRSAEVVVNDKIDKLLEIKDIISNIQHDIKSYSNKEYDLNAELKISVSELNAINSEDSSVIELRKLEEFKKTESRLTDLKYNLAERKNIQTISSMLLKDSGIKTGIIKEYIPILNSLTNKFLQDQDCFIQFELDEEFNEKIKSRHRDDFSYASFSEGEKMRIDIALLFTWREIAKRKNSASANILILDEILDSSLDSEGLDSGMGIIERIASDGSNIFVISHSSNEYTERFDRVIEFTKKNDFSTLK